MERNYPKATITEKGERTLRGGHPWVYADEVTEVSGEYENGGLADVFSRKGRYLGTGYINDNSKIRIRVISRNANDKFDRDFYARRIRYALDYRRTVMGAEDFRCCRLIFGEADSFPGFTVDRFGDVLVAQVLSLGTERVKDALYELLVQTLADMGEHISAIYERNDVKIRELEGMEEYKGFWAGAGLRTDLSGVTEITENGIKKIHRGLHQRSENRILPRSEVQSPGYPPHCGGTYRPRLLHAYRLVRAERRRSRSKVRDRRGYLRGRHRDDPPQR